MLARALGAFGREPERQRAGRVVAAVIDQMQQRALAQQPALREVEHAAVEIGADAAFGAAPEARILQREGRRDGMEERAPQPFAARDLVAAERASTARCSSSVVAAKQARGHTSTPARRIHAAWRASAVSSRPA